MASLVKIPGPVDPHVHLRSMDWSHKGTFASETAAAAAGGYWCVLDMPNTMPSTVNKEALNRKLTELQAQSVSDWGVYFGASQDKNWEVYPDIVNSVCGLKIFNNATTGNLLIDDQSIRDQHYAAWPKNKAISVHAEEETILEILELVRKYGKHTHFLHISTAKEMGFLTAAKEEGLPITIGVCPHHLWLTEKDAAALGSHGWMKPTLKTQADQDALWKAIDAGIVDVVESDHAPHTLKEKATDKPPYGVPGLETTIPLLFTAVHEGRLTTEQVIDFVSTNPRKIFGLPLPDATYTVIDLEATYLITGDHLHTQCGWSPYEGMQVFGKVVETWIRGTKVYDGENILVQSGFGENCYG